MLQLSLLLELLAVLPVPTFSSLSCLLCSCKEKIAGSIKIFFLIATCIIIIYYTPSLHSSSNEDSRLFDGSLDLGDEQPHPGQAHYDPGCRADPVECMQR